MKKNFMLEVLVFLIFSGLFYSQQCPDGSSCTSYVVQKQESIYGISRKFGITQQDLLQCNPDLVKTGLKAGQVICIPKPAQSVSVTSSVQPLPEFYVVKKGDTFFSIQKQFNLTRAELLELNPGINPEQLAEGTQLRLKKKPEGELNEIVQYYKNKKNITSDSEVKIINGIPKDIPVKNHYTLTVLLPAVSPEAMQQTPLDWEKNISFPEDASLATEYWYGLQYAAGVHASQDFSLTLQIVHEDRKDSVFDAYWNAFIQRGGQPDGIVGPFYAQHIDKVSEFTRKKNLPLVSPWVLQNKFLYENPFAIKITTSQQTLVENLGRYVYDSLFQNRYKVVCYQLSVKDQREQSFLQVFRHAFRERSQKKDSLPVLKNITDLKNFIQQHEKVVVAAFSQNKVLMTDFITQSYLASQKKDVVFCGLKQLLEMDNLDLEYLNVLHYTFPSFMPMQLLSGADSLFMQSFRKTFSVPPSEAAYLGKATGDFLFISLKEKGWNFLQSEKAEWKDEHVPMKFVRPDFRTGLDNVDGYIYRIDNYQFRRTGWR